MAKKQRSVSLSFVLFRFAIIMLGCMLLCCLIWFLGFRQLQNNDIIYSGYVSNQQVEQLLAEKPKTFISPDENFLAEYALFKPTGEVLESNTDGKKLEFLRGFFKEDASDIHVTRYTYADKSTLIMHWYYRAEFANPLLRSILPPFEYLWLAALGISWVLCLLFHTIWLRRHLATKLKLFHDVSEKIGAQELDFTIPHAGIQEYDHALTAMEYMRDALYRSLSAQWAAQQERDVEIASLAHDLKTPLTLIGGNAELLLDEELSESSCKMVQTIASSNHRARQYVASLLETSVGTDESFERTNLPAMFDEFCQSMIINAETMNVCLETQNNLVGTACIQKNRLLRAFGNAVQNAIEHTPAGGTVYLAGSMIDSGWQVTVRDEGSGFSKAALHHAAERLWRGDTARSSDGHNGLGLWFAAQVVKTHAGQLTLHNCDSGGVVTMSFYLL